MEHLRSETGTSGGGVILDALSGIAQPGVVAGGASEDWGQGWKFAHSLALAAVLFCGHCAGSILLSGHGSVTCLGLGGCYGLASWAALAKGRLATGIVRMRWLLVSLGLFLGALSFALTLYRESVVGRPDELAGFQDVTLLLRGLPFLMAVSLGHRERSANLFGFDVAYSVLAAGLAWIALQMPSYVAGAGYFAVSSDTAFFLVTAANLTAAALASLRCFGSNAGDNRFFRMVAGFLWMNGIVSGLINFYVIQGWQVEAGSPALLFGDLPVLGLLLGFHLFDRRMDGDRSRPDGTTFSDVAGSLLVPFWLLLLAVSTAPRHPLLGVGGVAATFMVYGVRCVLLERESTVAQQELLRLNESMQDQALSDSLTCIPNRRSFDLTLEREWKRAQRSKQPLALLMVDVDKFKEVNDRHGHPAGDGCLREIARLLRTGLGREGDFAARYGGEEFAILLVGTGLDGGRIVGESLRRSVEQHQCTAPDSSILELTVSIGVASEIPMQQESSSTLVAAADKALYRAKRSGRNRVEVHAWRTHAAEELLLD